MYGPVPDVISPVPDIEPESSDNASAAAADGFLKGDYGVMMPHRARPFDSRAACQSRYARGRRKYRR